MQKVGEGAGAIETWDHGQSWLVLSLRKLLETNESISWNPVSPAVSLAIYSSDFFSLPLRRTPAPLAVEGAKLVEAERSARESLFGFLDKDQFQLVLCIDTLMFKYAYEVSCNGICFRMSVEREELEKFCTALEAELAHARAEDDLHGERRYAASLLSSLRLFGSSPLTVDRVPWCECAINGPARSFALPIGDRRRHNRACYQFTSLRVRGGAISSRQAAREVWLAPIGCSAPTLRSHQTAMRSRISTIASRQTTLRIRRGAMASRFWPLKWHDFALHGPEVGRG